MCKKRSICVVLKRINRSYFFRSVLDVLYVLQSTSLCSATIIVHWLIIRFGQLIFSRNVQCVANSHSEFFSLFFSVSFFPSSNVHRGILGMCVFLCLASLLFCPQTRRRQCARTNNIAMTIFYAVLSSLFCSYFFKFLFHVCYTAFSNTFVTVEPHTVLKPMVHNANATNDTKMLCFGNFLEVPCNLLAS